MTPPTVARMILLVIGTPPPSLRHSQKLLLLHQLRNVELLPGAALLVGVLGLDPGNRRALLARRELRRVAQPQRAVDQQGAAHAEALADQQQPRLLAERHRRAAEERRE